MQYEFEFQSFHNKWIENIDYLNTSMRAIRKVQQECDITSL